MSKKGKYNLYNRPTLEGILDNLSCFSNSIASFCDNSGSTKKVNTQIYTLPIKKMEEGMISKVVIGNKVITAYLGFVIKKPSFAPIYFDIGENAGLIEVPKRDDLLYLPLELTGKYINLKYSNTSPVPTPLEVYGVKGKFGSLPIGLLQKGNAKHKINFFCASIGSPRSCYVELDSPTKEIIELERRLFPIPSQRTSKKRAPPTINKPNEEIKWEDPKSIVNYLNQYVIGQEQAKKTLAVAFSNYMLRKTFNDESIPKNNVLLIGPSGSGKTYMIQLLSKKAELPMVIQNLTDKTVEGYVGENLSRFWKDFRKRTEGEAPYGIIFLDELDKCISGRQGHLEMKEGLQDILIPWIEEATISGTNKGGDESLPLNTKNLLFIFAGAFNGHAGETNRLLEIIKKRMNTNTKSIGFDIISQSEKEQCSLHDLKPEDLVKYGLKYELVGRIPSIGVLDQLTIDEKVRILKETKDSVLNNYVKLLKLRGYEMKIDETVPQIIVNYCPPETGARALRSMCDKMFTEIIYDPSLYSKGELIHITEKVAETIFGKPDKKSFEGQC